MKLSIVTTLYHSENYIEEFCRRASVAAENFAGEDFEIIFVNDGSPDDSLDKSVALASVDHHVIVIDLSRNFGHHNAMMAGLSHAVGDYVFLIDSDLEEEPEWLADFSTRMHDGKFDVVFGVQKTRKGKWFERVSGEIYYWILSWLLSIEHPKNITTARLMTRRYVRALLLHEEREIVISGLWLLTGFKQSQYSVHKKQGSRSTYSFRRKISHLINVVTSFSSRPLILIFATGMVILGVLILYLSFLLIRRFFFLAPLDGWTSIMASIWLLGGITISFIGVIGIYLSKLFTEVKRRPTYIVKNRYGRRKEN